MVRYSPYFTVHRSHCSACVWYNLFCINYIHFGNSFRFRQNHPSKTKANKRKEKKTLGWFYSFLLLLPFLRHILSNKKHRRLNYFCTSSDLIFNIFYEFYFFVQKQRTMSLNSWPRNAYGIVIVEVWVTVKENSFFIIIQGKKCATG